MWRSPSAAAVDTSIGKIHLEVGKGAERGCPVLEASAQQFFLVVIPVLVTNKAIRRIHLTYLKRRCKAYEYLDKDSLQYYHSPVR